ncbi:MAG TPA: DUF692 family protein [Anaerolineaceae bacterium]|jgi:uncharacterized protein (UPF0276 family)|nr:DUF692 family protein [Chloroflexota bacterium]HOA21626.1 DUF692 family protein [Anaerolineaceae bacterium]HOG77430.1 DUF692 family protein [Anaerolineaceae bacterium]
MQISVNHSQALLDLVRAGHISVDAVEWVDKLPVSLIVETRELFPSLAFHLHPGRFHRTGAWLTQLRNYLEVCPQTPHISVHLAPLPWLWTDATMRRGRLLPGPLADASIRRFIREVKWLQRNSNLPLILENMPALHPKRYLFESDPAVIGMVLEETNCAFLLDLAHARIAAEARGISPETYLAALPLEKTAQIHLAGVRAGRDGRLFDAHEPLTVEDYRLLEWTLARAQPAWLTLEYFREEPQAVADQVKQLETYLSSS